MTSSVHKPNALTADTTSVDQGLRAIVEHMPTALMVADQAGNVVLINSQFEQMFGYTKHEMVGQSVSMLVPDYLRLQHDSLMLDYLKTPESRPMGAGRDLFAVKKNHELFPVEIGLMPVTISGTKYVLASIVNLSERMRYEAELRAANDKLTKNAAELERFLYTISHDLKSPLITAATFVEMAEEEFQAGNTQEASNALARVKKSHQKMTRLIADLLAFFRADYIEELPSVVNLSQLMEGILLDHQDEVKSAAFEIKISPELPMIFANRTRVFQIFENLLLNALQYGRGKKNVVSVESILTESHLIIYVADHGPGVPKDYWTKVFELFTRLVSDTKGTGVGLAIVKRSAEALGGSVQIEPSAEGTRFAVSLPRSCLYKEGK